MILEYRINWHRRKIARLSAEIKTLWNFTEGTGTDAYVSQIVRKQGHLAELEKNLEILLDRQYEKSDIGRTANKTSA